MLLQPPGWVGDRVVARLNVGIPTAAAAQLAPRLRLAAERLLGEVLGPHGDVEVRVNLVDE